MERVKKLENSTEESLGIEETVCMKSVVRNWKGKEKAYEFGKIVFLMESRVRENLMHGLMIGG